MQAQSSTPGSGRLDFERVAGRTVVRQALARNPLRLLTPRNHGDGAWVYTSSYGGGLVGGDHVALDARVREGASAVLLTQSTTKVYRSPAGASQSLSTSVGPGARLCVLPDPVSCFEGSSYSQRQEHRLAPGASLLVFDAFSSGRYGSGERWLFDRFASRIEVLREEQPVFLESLVLDGGAGALAARNGRFNAHGLLYLTGRDFEEPGRALVASITKWPLRKRRDLVVSAAPLPREGFVMRLAAVATEELTRAVREALDFLPTLLGDDPWRSNQRCI